MFTIILIALILTLLQWGLYKIKAGRFFLYILPIICIILQICIIFRSVREQALLSSQFPLWLRIVIHLIPLLVSLFIMAGFIVRKYMRMKYTKPFYHTVLRLFIFFLIGMIIILLGTVYLAQEYVIFYPNESIEDTQYLMKETSCKRIVLKDEFYGWEQTHENSKEVLVYFGGNAQNTSTVFRQYKETGVFDILNDYDIISVDYPEYGDSEGTLSQDHLFEMADALMRYTKEHHPDQKITIIGYSIGTGIASYAAHAYQPDHFILLSPYDNGKDLFNSYLPMFYGPLSFLIRYPLTSDEYVSDVTAKSLVLYTDQDTIVKPYLTKRLIDAFTTKPTVIVYTEYTHGDMVTTPAIWKDIIEFLKST